MKRNSILILFLFTFFSHKVKGSGLVIPEYNNTAILSFFDCEPDIFLSETENNSSFLYWAANSIRVDNNYRIIVNSDSEITMKAGEVIVLKPKTAILHGNHYLAKIEACNSDSDTPSCIPKENTIFQKGISPNGDVWNESFDLSAYCVDHIKIYNRYGLLVYEAENYTNEWHGQSDKGDLPSATYYYVITFSKGKTITGWIYLQR